MGNLSRPDRALNRASSLPHCVPAVGPKGRDGNGREVVVALFFLANGLVTVAPCK